jgi:hypothetical protein
VKVRLVDRAHRRALMYVCVCGVVVLQVRFILSVVDGRLVVSNRKKAELLQELAQLGFELFDGRCTGGLHACCATYTSGACASACLPVPWLVT